jgi:hypothetical protein
LNLFALLDKNQIVTKMSAHNLAVVMGPTLIRSAGESFESMMLDSSRVVSVVTYMIENLLSFQKFESNGPLSELNLNNLIETDKRDWKKKFEDMKKAHDEVYTLYDELRTQFSVLEAYSSKLDYKVLELEEILENRNSKPQEVDLNSPVPSSIPIDEIHKLRSENDWLKEIIIRSTREDVTNFREDPRHPLTKASTLNKSMSSLVSPVDGESELSNSTEDSDVLKVKLTSTMLRKQISSKKIPKQRLKEQDNAIKRENAQSLKRTFTRKEFDVDKKVLFEPTSEFKHPTNENKPPTSQRDDKFLTSPYNDSKTLPLNEKPITPKDPKPTTHDRPLSSKENKVTPNTNDKLYLTKDKDKKTYFIKR